MTRTTRSLLASPFRWRFQASRLARVTSLGLLGFLGGCGIFGRGPDVGDLLQLDPLQDRRILASEEVDDFTAGMIEALDQAMRDRPAPIAERRLLLPPLAGEGSEWEASALSWSLLRQSGGFIPSDPRPSTLSVPAVQAWLRGRGDDAVAWLVETSGRRQVEARFLAVTADRVWSTAIATLQVSADQRRSWPLQFDHSIPLDRRVVDTGERLTREAERVWVEDARGRRELRWRKDQLHLDERRGWADFGASWLERRGQPEALPVLAVLDGERRLELHRDDLPPGEGNVWSWSLASGGASLRLPVELRRGASALSLLAAPESWGVGPAWLLLERSDSGAVSVGLYAAALRIVRPARDPRSDAPPIDAEIVVSAEPVDQLMRGSSAWLNWTRLHCGVPLAHYDLDGVARPEPGIAWAMEEGGRRWRFSLPRPDGIALEDWRRAFVAMFATLGVERLPVDADEVGVTMESDRLVLQFPRPIPDLAERLCHPTFALRDPALERRFASHHPPSSSGDAGASELNPGFTIEAPRWGSDRGELRLRPRHEGIPELVVRFDANPARRRSAFLLGESHVLRPYALGVDDPLLRAPVARAPAALGDPARRRSVAGEDVHVLLLVPSSAFYEPVREQLHRTLAGISPYELLAVDDDALRPVGPITGTTLGGSRRESSDSASDGIAGPRLTLEEPRSEELARAADRLEVFLRAQGLEVHRIEEGLADTPPLKGARLRRVILFSREPLLRALELYTQLGRAALPDERWRDAVSLPVGHPDRKAAARAAELALLETGTMFPLWTEPGTVLLDRQLVGEETQGTGPAPSFRGARRHGSASLEAMLP